MDSFGGRAQLSAALDKAMERAQKSQRDEAAGQHGLFGIFDSDIQTSSNGHKEDALPSVAEWDEHTRLQNEKEVLGFFVSGHPLDKYREKLRNMKVVDTATACEMKPEPQVFRRRGRRAAERDSDRRRHHRPQGRKIETLRRAVRAGHARRHRRQDRAHRLLRQSTRSSQTS